MRDPNGLKVFAMADALARAVYEWTVQLPSEEKYTLVSQLRRSALSVPSNLVEGCSRESQADFRRFVEIALGSAMELRYQLMFAADVYSMIPRTAAPVNDADTLVGALIGFLRALRAES